jgi:hypothetical protein
VSDKNLKTVQITVSPHGANPTASPHIKQLQEIRSHLSSLDYPIATHAALLKMATPGHRYFVDGREIEPEKAIPKIPAEFFPIQSQEDFEKKIASEFQRQRGSAHPSSVPVPRVHKKPTKDRG